MQTEKTVTFFSLITVTYGQKKKKKKIEQKTLHSQKKCELALTCLLYNFSCFSLSQKNSNAIKKKKVDLGRQRL